MEAQRLLDALGPGRHPVGLCGCRQTQLYYDCCQHDITIFDGRAPTGMIQCDGAPVLVHHGSLDESDPARLVYYLGMTVLRDERWDLRMLVRRVEHGRSQIFSSHAKSRLVESLMCLSRAAPGDAFAQCWTKTAAFALAGAMILLDLQAPMPEHCLQMLRAVKGGAGRRLDAVTDCIGVERASPSVLSRMAESTVGFSELVRGPVYSDLIRSKCHHMIKGSMLADCYFYLGYVNSENMMRSPDLVRSRPDLIHILKVAYDIEGNAPESCARTLRQTAERLLYDLTRQA